jgi:hypothetical protein
MRSLTRRSFTGTLALSALAPLLRRVPGSAPSAENPASPAGSPLPPKPGAEARALAGALEARYGSQLAPGDLATITEQIQGSLDRADRLRKVDLTNGDEPDFVFRAHLSPTAQ